MALPLPPGLIPSEVVFLCEMELVTIIPRQRLDSLSLLEGPTAALRPPQRAAIPLWLALLLKRQRRANIVPPPWLYPDRLANILDNEISEISNAFSPGPPLPSIDRASSLRGIPDPSTAITTAPFLPSCTADAPADALPYHWLEMSEILLDSASDDIVDPEAVRKVLRDLREARMAKVRQQVIDFDPGAGLNVNGIGAMEVSEGRAFVKGALDTLRKIGASRETSRKERELELGTAGGTTGLDDDDDEDMDI